MREREKVGRMVERERSRGYIAHLTGARLLPKQTIYPGTVIRLDRTGFSWHALLHRGKWEERERERENIEESSFSLISYKVGQRSPRREVRMEKSTQGTIYSSLLGSSLSTRLTV